MSGHDADAVAAAVECAWCFCLLRQVLHRPCHARHGLFRPCPRVNNLWPGVCYSWTVVHAHTRKGLLLTALLAAVVAIGLVDWLTGPRISLALFYAIPITLSGWLLGHWAAVVTSVAAGCGIYLGDLAQQAEALTVTHLWNTAVRLIFLVAVGQLTARVRRDRDRLRALLSKETSARIATVEQLRHRDRLAMVGQVASGIAHEVGTPLHVITGRARFITEPDATLDEARGHAAAIIEQSDRVATTIRQLLDFARRRGPQRDEVNLLDLTRRTQALLRPLALKRRVEVTLSGKSLPATASVDPNQVEQAIGNLVINAIQAIRGEGVVTLCVQPVRRSPPPDISGEESDWVAISVEDNGTGIAPDDLAHIFEPFFTTQSAGEGTGLGLSITQEIIRDHGGWIEVESEPWKGTRFTVILPTSHRPETAAKA